LLNSRKRERGGEGSGKISKDLWRAGLQASSISSPFSFLIDEDGGEEEEEDEDELKKRTAGQSMSLFWERPLISSIQSNPKGGEQI
jgi:hypothetical protein